MTATETPENKVVQRKSPRSRTDIPNQHPDGNDWSSWPLYNEAEMGLRDYWYPVEWAEKIGSKPLAVQLLGEKIALVRDGDKIYALRDRCPHRGVPLSLGRRQYDGTISCPYHGWTFELDSGNMCAALTDGPESPINNNVSVATYAVEQRFGMVWIYIGDGDTPPVERDIPDELVENKFVFGGQIDLRDGNWRFAAENGFDEGHAKYLHNTALWRLFKVMPAWNKTRIVESGEEDGNWLIRVQDEVHWEADFPGLGKWTNKRWWKRMPLPDAPDKGKNVNPVIAGLKIPGFVSVRLPGLLRVAYPNFIHYEWYVPVDKDHVRYVQMMVRFESGFKAKMFKFKYLTAIRWLFHGQFTAQDAWMVDVMDAPPEKLYRPDLSLTAWRRHIEKHKPKIQKIVPFVGNKK